MYNKIAILSIIFLFICWLLYNINVLEGFQTSSETVNTPYTSEQCEILVNSYKSLEQQYNRVVENDNKELMETILSSKNSMKDIIKGMNCNI
jgi:hypothetical protein